MSDLIPLTKTVQQVLIEVPESRDDDLLLALEVYKRRGVDTHMPFDTLVFNHSLHEIESISRCRRKVQELFPKLKTVDGQERRAIRREQFRQYAINTNRQDVTE